MHRAGEWLQQAWPAPLAGKLGWWQWLMHGTRWLRRWRGQSPRLLAVSLFGDFCTEKEALRRANRQHEGKTREGTSKGKREKEKKHGTKPNSPRPRSVLSIAFRHRNFPPLGGARREFA
jgi:hypothetical protein